IASLAVAPVDSYGVGTSVVTGSGAPTCGMVYKLVLREGADGRMEPVQKASAAKGSVGGRKSAARRLEPSGRASEELVVAGAAADWQPEEEDLRALLVPLVRDGMVQPGTTGAEGVRRAAARHAASRAELSPYSRRLSAGDPAIPTTHVHRHPLDG